jgi:hypothetical protein
MGVQQLLLIVLGVIIVGLAVAVGIWMFQFYAYNANVNAILADFNSMRLDAITYWATPIFMGGAGKETDLCSIDALASAIGFDLQDSESILQMALVKETINGSYKINSFEDGELVIHALGKVTKAGKHPYIQYEYNLCTDELSVEIHAASQFPQ